MQALISLIHVKDVSHIFFLILVLTGFSWIIPFKHPQILLRCHDACRYGSRPAKVAGASNSWTTSRPRLCPQGAERSVPNGQTHICQVWEEDISNNRSNETPKKRNLNRLKHLMNTIKPTRYTEQNNHLFHCQSLWLDCLVECLPFTMHSEQKTYWKPFLPLLQDFLNQWFPFTLVEDKYSLLSFSACPYFQSPWRQCSFED